MKKTNSIATILAFLIFSNLAIGSTTVPLNTGYKHSIFTPYPTVTTLISPPPARDDYWINIASYPITGAAIGPAWILRTWPGWTSPFVGTNWIGARNTAASPAGTTQANPAYTIFRKCFCLLPNFRDASLRLKQVRADNTIQVWLNSQMNQIIAPSWGNYNGTPLSGATTNQQWFRVGRNCVYALVEDFGAPMGFDLQGDVTATGLLPTAAWGTEGTNFKPCECQGPAGVTGGRGAVSVDDDDKEVIQTIVKIAEARRASKQRMQYQGNPPK